MIRRISTGSLRLKPFADIGEVHPACITASDLKFSLIHGEDGVQGVKEVVVVGVTFIRNRIPEGDKGALLKTALI